MGKTDNVMGKQTKYKTLIRECNTAKPKKMCFIVGGDSEKIYFSNYRKCKLWIFFENNIVASIKIKTL